tara:strand:+ start:46 stop:324 length:279 start_codon:yes stop_codon:yes gene_type:complete
VLAILKKKLEEAEQAVTQENLMTNEVTKGSMGEDLTDGKSYCNDMQEHSKGYSQYDLFDCYRRHLSGSQKDYLWYGRLFCNYHFPVDSDDET